MEEPAAHIEVFSLIGKKKKHHDYINTDVFTHLELRNVVWDTISIFDLKQDFAALSFNYKNM